MAEGVTTGSEESGTESSEDIYVKPLPWRASRVDSCDH